MTRLAALTCIGSALLIANEIRGLVLAVPVILVLWESGGSLMAWWIAFCSLVGIGLSVIVPYWVFRRVGNG